MNDTLEQLIDSASLQEVLSALAEICHEKADHLRSNWQDESSAKVWERDAQAIERCASKVNN
ncbi:MAG: hypothetical protein DWQ31_17140 [Planctomycetota bacterium]|nr:MAG: hypothetical protein DWQ31_17140 [Planctomycetota bacterium]REJ92178.1 MAG: hypothetical protein DWQ35_13090 [Planctomycetota bacterium]REK28705.1 MAG: hypothetical protein DWQ42_04680 [Planctomycetota bacterium]REK39495.1 MAG: hypothetical protein DWQ46_18260 [Planctomycetota bacterium]